MNSKSKASTPQSQEPLAPFNFLLTWIISLKFLCLQRDVDLSLKKALEIAKDPKKCPHAGAAATLKTTANLADEFEARCGVSWGDAIDSELAAMATDSGCTHARAVVDALAQEQEAEKEVADSGVHWIADVGRLLKRFDYNLTLDEAVDMLNNCSVRGSSDAPRQMSSHQLGNEIKRVYNITWAQLQTSDDAKAIGIESPDLSVHSAAVTKLLKLNANLPSRGYAVAEPDLDAPGKQICGHCLDPDSHMPDLDSPEWGKWIRMHSKCPSKRYAVLVPVTASASVDDGAGPSGTSSITASHPEKEPQKTTVHSTGEKYHYIRDPPSPKAVHLSTEEIFSLLKEIKEKRETEKNASLVKEDNASE